MMGVRRRYSGDFKVQVVLDRPLKRGQSLGGAGTFLQSIKAGECQPYLESLQRRGLPVAIEIGR
jgi:hypothetical protein